MSVPADTPADRPACGCDQHNDPAKVAWSAWLRPRGDGNAQSITVAKSAGGHLIEADAQWVRDRLNDAGAAT